MKQDILSALRPAIVMGLLVALLLGIAYPFATLGIGQLLFPKQANGSLIVDGSQVVGSELIGQAFASDRYFHGRPSAAGKGYDGLASSGSNLGPTSQVLADRVKADVASYHQTVADRPVPPDLVTTSASGLDPDISPEAALYQADRVAHARGLSPAKVRDMIAAETRGSWLGFLGEPRVNVLALNRRLNAERRP